MKFTFSRACSKIVFKGKISDSLQKVVFSFGKDSNHQNHSCSGSLYLVKKSHPPVKFMIPPTGGEFTNPPLTAIWKTLYNKNNKIHPIYYHSIISLNHNLTQENSYQKSYQICLLFYKSLKPNYYQQGEVVLLGVICYRPKSLIWSSTLLDKFIGHFSNVVLFSFKNLLSAFFRHFQNFIMINFSLTIFVKNIFGLHCSFKDVFMLSAIHGGCW